MDNAGESAFVGHAPGVTIGKIFNPTMELRWHIRKNIDAQGQPVHNQAVSFLQQKWVAWDGEETWRDIPVLNESGIGA
jgi:hypothetical protein